MSKRVFAVSVLLEGERLYFVRNSSRSIEIIGEQVLSEPVGIFSHDVKDAKKFETKEQAEYCASYFDNSQIEIIKEGERLK